MNGRIEMFGAFTVGFPEIYRGGNTEFLGAEAVEERAGFSINIIIHVCKQYFRLGLT